MTVQVEHSAILSTFIKLLFVMKIIVLLFLGGRFTQVLLYIEYYRVITLILVNIVPRMLVCKHL